MSDIIKYKDFKDLKEKITHECDRRILSHEKSKSLKDYGDNSNYNFTQDPNSQTLIKKEHYQKIFEPLQAFNNDKFTYNSNKKIIEEDEIILAKSFIISAYDRDVYDAMTTDCTNGSCTGLCYGLCYSVCG